MQLVPEIDIRPSKKKPLFPINKDLQRYLKLHGREVKLPVTYEELFNFTYSIPQIDKEGNYTQWDKVGYDIHEWDYINQGLLEIYAIIKTEGDTSFIDHLKVANIEYCTFGNSHPFRIRIINKYNDNYDHYYIKKADASRVYGLELEHILSPNRIIFFTYNNTLVEEHIPGIPGDIFVQRMLHAPTTNQVRLAKEFVKFNERCFVRLLGDMRSYNFVIDITPDIRVEDYQYRIRAIDFDQQSYEGRKNIYLPQFFKENNPFVDVTLKQLNQRSIEQYQAEERTLITFRLASARYRIKQLLDIMAADTISTPDKQLQLITELNNHFNTEIFSRCKSMGKIVKRQLKQTLQSNLRLVKKNIGKENQLFS